VATLKARPFSVGSDAIDDWLVPVVLQSGSDFSVARKSLSTVKSRDQKSTTLGVTPPPPDIGFVGSDDGLLGVDRSFDHNNVVLLYGLAGAGKTATAIEFCRWYVATNNSIEKILFTSFERVPTLEELIAPLENFLPRDSSVQQWSRLESRERRQVVITLLRKASVVWIWDNVESVEVLPRERRQELADFLKDAASAGVKLLLTARGVQDSWLGQAAVLVRMPPLRFSESSEFAGRVIRRLGRENVLSSTVSPILEFADGNPLTLSVALAAFLDSNRNPSLQAAEAFVKKLEAGDVTFNDDQADGRDRSLRASLRYGFDRAFSLPNLRLLALLYLFRAYVNTWVLVLMGHPPDDPVSLGFADYDFQWTLPKLASLSPKQIEEVLDRAARLGLLSKKATNHFWMHPAIQVHLKSYFQTFYSTPTKSAQATRAFAESIGMFSVHFAVVYGHGVRDPIIEALSNEEPNLLRALELSHEYGWWQAEIGVLHGLFALYSHKGRLTQWAEILKSVTPDFLDHNSHPLPGRDKWWSFVVDHLWRVADRNKDLSKAERLARSVLAWEESRCKEIKSKTHEQMSVQDRQSLQFLAIATSRLADTLRDRGSPECLDLNDEALRLYRSIDDRVGVAIRLFNLGHVFKNVKSLRDLSKSAHYYSEAHEAYPEYDKMARSQCLGQLGSVSLELMREALGSKAPESSSLRHLNEAIEYYEASLDLKPSDAIMDLALTHNQLGVAYLHSKTEQLKSLEHFRMAISYFDAAKEWLLSAGARLNAAQILEILSRSQEGKQFALEAVNLYESLGYDGPELARAKRMLSSDES
jgi:tetratricopeptide (TPR) repeat protein